MALVALLGPRASENLVVSVRNAVESLRQTLRAGSSNKPSDLITMAKPSVGVPLSFLADALSPGWSAYVTDLNLDAG
jgi:hypothetical protein